MTRLEAEGIDHDVLVIDDASKDRTAAVVAEIAVDHPQVRCVRSHNPPASASPCGPVSTFSRATRWRS